MSNHSTPISWLKSEEDGFVTSTTRRWIYISNRNGEILQGTVATKALDITVGDRVHFEEQDDHPLIDSYQPRKNALQRHLGKRSKLLCSNLDVLFVVTAVGKLFQPVFVDRVLCVATLEEIPTVLVVNKVDLEIDQETQALINVYRSLGIEVLETSTVEEDGLVPVFNHINKPDLQAVSLVGVSGVGKSSILNQLIPDAERMTNEVSEKTGLGRQTTSQAEAFRYTNDSGADLFLIDLPGVQLFGISNLDRKSVEQGMTDIYALSAGCEYSDCHHIAEPNCAVKDALEKDESDPNRLSLSRYQSYLGMLEEIEKNREY